jgi:hypothetical protein
MGGRKTVAEFPGIVGRDRARDKRHCERCAANADESPRKNRPARHSHDFLPDFFFLISSYFFSYFSSYFSLGLFCSVLRFSLALATASLDDASVFVALRSGLRFLQASVTKST